MKKNKAKVQGIAKGRVLYLVETSHYMGTPKMHEWVVTSIMRPPRRGTNRYYPLPKAEKRVYLKFENEWGTDRSHFELSDWPGQFSATKRAAWKQALKTLRRRIAQYEQELTETLDMKKDDEFYEHRLEIVADIKKALKTLRTGLTKVSKKIKA